MHALLPGAAFTSIAARVPTASFLVVMMFSLGLEIEALPRKDKRAKRHERRLLLRALVLNLVVLPLITYGIVRALHASGAIATAVLLAAATPGGRFAPQVAKMARAELGLAVDITLFLAKLTAFTAPLTMKWLIGARHIELHDLQIMAQLVVLQVVPYLLGKLARRKRPSLGPALMRPLVIAELILGVAFLAVLVGSRTFAPLSALGPKGWAAGALFAVIALALGWTVGGSEAQARRAFAVTAAARNLGLGLVIAGELLDDATIQLALFGIWLICLVAGVAFAAAARVTAAVRARPSPPAAPTTRSAIPRRTPGA
jgi:bile acid:Na+ symporter, BASS family